MGCKLLGHCVQLPVSVSLFHSPRISQLLTPCPPVARGEAWSQPQVEGPQVTRNPSTRAPCSLLNPFPDQVTATHSSLQRRPHLRSPHLSHPALNSQCFIVFVFSEAWDRCLIARVRGSQRCWPSAGGSRRTPLTCPRQISVGLLLGTSHKKGPD